MKSLLGKTKGKLKKFLEIKEYILDLRRYHRHTNFGFNSDSSQRMKLSEIAKYYHIIEKGLTMPDTRFGFGALVIERIIGYCNTYLDKGYDANEIEFLHAINVLNEYLAFHKQKDVDIEPHLSVMITKLTNRVTGSWSASGQPKSSPEDFFAYVNSPFEEFALNRHTVRHFSDRDIDVDILIKCVKIAQKSPSACNRQPNGVVIVKDKTIINEILKLQSGNRGFGHLSNTLLVVTSDISVFSRSLEKFGPHFNSGMFSMSLIYALHHYCIGNCALNWSTSYEKDKALRSLLNIADNEYITLIIACGYPPKEFNYPSSPRRLTEQIYKVV